LAADFDALFHIAHLCTALGAGVTSLRTDSANALVQRKSTQHQVCGGLADLGTSLHQPEMLRLDMLAALLQAMMHGGFQTNAVTALAMLDAMLHFGVLRR
jgi:hypothetical protein